MKINSIRIKNFLRIRSFQTDLDLPITIVCGDNESGKTSIQDAVKLALLGETPRIHRKTDYGQYVIDNEREAMIALAGDFGERIISILSSGRDTKGVPSVNTASLVERAVLDMDYLLGLTPDELRSCLFNVIGVDFTPSHIAGLLAEEGFNKTLVARIEPFLQSGFETACNEVRDMQKEQRGVWKGITKETYGVNKAQRWQAKEVELPDASEMREIQDRMQEVEDEIAQLSLPDVAEKQLDIGMSRLECPACGTALMLEKGQLVVILEDPEEMAEPEPEAPPEDDEGDDQVIIAMKDELYRLQSRLDAIKEAKMLNRIAAEKTQQAKEAHDILVELKTLESRLGPSGLPRELLAKQLPPFNDLLSKYAASCGWSLTKLENTGDITYDGRNLHLLAESAKWKVKLALITAIAALHDIKTVLIDRVDILSPRSRGSLLDFCEMANREHDINFLLFATLKAPPQFDGVKTIWLEDGEMV